MFWLTGLAAYLSHPGGTSTLHSWTRWLNYQATATQLTVSVAGLLASPLQRSSSQPGHPGTAAGRGLLAVLGTPLHRRLATWLATRAAEEATAWQDAYASVPRPTPGSAAAGRPCPRR
jgi:hypothetical protein